MNLMFEAEGCSPLICEIQIHHARILELQEESHLLYEVVRATSMEALRK